MGSGFGNMALTSAMWLFGVSALIVLFVMPSEEKSQAMGRLLSEKDRQFTHQVYFDISEGGKLLGRVTFGLYGNVVRLIPHQLPFVAHRLLFSTTE